ncbi:MAG TPA: metal-dependent hydrolase [Methanocella sp.]|nr:metal-dependent hydrolase [Methanocella sp.]
MIFFGHIGLTLLVVFALSSLIKEDADYRLVVAGAMLPDIIDKPIGHYLFYSTFENGRIFAHTIAFAVLLTGVCIYAERRRLLDGARFIALASVLHIIEDQMWNTKQTLFWPLLGWEFPKINLDNYFGNILNELIHDPSVYIPEITGFIIIFTFIWYFRLYRPENAAMFARTGKFISPVI